MVEEDDDDVEEDSEEEEEIDLARDLELLADGPSLAVKLRRS